MSELFSIVGIGEVLWDLLPTGPRPGGAPANFTFHARSLGARATLVSRIGDDDLGHKLLRRLKDLGMTTECVALDSVHPTGTVSVELENGQPRYVIHKDVAWDFLEGNSDAVAAVRGADAVCFGTLAQRNEVSRKSIQQLLEATRPGALRVCDVNLRQNFYTRELIADSLARANVLKLNDAELPVLSELFLLKGDTRQQLAALARQFELRLIALTRGAQGSVLFDGSTWSEHPGTEVKLEDTIGAGDSFTAATVLGFLSQWPLDRINSFANEVAAFVCSQPGATPSLPEHFRKQLEPISSHA